MRWGCHATQRVEAEIECIRGACAAARVAVAAHAESARANLEARQRALMDAVDAAEAAQVADLERIATHIDKQLENIEDATQLRTLRVAEIAFGLCPSPGRSVRFVPHSPSTLELGTCVDTRGLRTGDFDIHMVKRASTFFEFDFVLNSSVAADLERSGTVAQAWAELRASLHDKDCNSVAAVRFSSEKKLEDVLRMPVHVILSQPNFMALEPFEVCSRPYTLAVRVPRAPGPHVLCVLLSIDFRCRFVTVQV